jgi:hypothetical protein
LPADLDEEAGMADKGDAHLSSSCQDGFAGLSTASSYSRMTD